MKYIDLFCGIGGFRMGFENHTCVFASEINKECRKIYQANYGELPHGDITKIAAKDIPDFDVLCAGFPCQPFSSCGQHKGFEDTRGTLFFDICRIIKEKKPKAILLENVTGLLYHDNGNTFKVILNSLKELGYIISYKVLNAKDFGLAQNRERIIIVASKVPFEFKFKQFKNITIRNILENNSDWLDKSEYTLIDKSYIKNTGMIFIGYRNKNTRKGTDKDLNLSRAHKQPNRIYSINGLHPTIPSQESSGRFFIYIPELDKVRKLTLLEVYRLFGFPDNFIKSKSKSAAYKQIGNSVCIPMIQEIAEQISLIID